jgi:hypothetical protein
MTTSTSDGKTGFAYLRARYYYTATGQFIYCYPLAGQTDKDSRTRHG